MTTMNVDSIVLPVIAAQQSAQTNLQNYAQTMNPTDTSQLLQFQYLTQNYSVTSTLESGIVEAMGQMMRSIVQHIGA